MSSTERNEEVEIDLLHGEGRHSDQTPSSRDVWARKSEYMLSLIGYTVGLSNVWRFPFLCMKNGGGAFLIPFLFFLVICGLPLYHLELCLGQFSGKSPLVVWDICPLVTGLGYAMVFASLIVTWYYATVIAWVLYYLGYSFSATLPWSTCDNDWNTDRCIAFRSKTIPSSSVNLTSIHTNVTTIDNYVNSTVQMDVDKTGFRTSASEFWRYKVLNMSSGIDDWGELQWPIVLTLFLSYGTTFLCIVKGVRSIGKVVWVTALMPYILLTVILIRSLMLDGAIDGIIFYIKPDFNRIANFSVWYEAALQVFFSLGPAWGGIITMASFSRFNNKCFSDAVLVTATDMLTAFYCGFVVFSIVGFLAHEAGMKIEDVVEAGPGLVFFAYPEALARLPLPQFWSVLFFVMLYFVGLDSQFGLLESIISGLTDKYPKTLGQHKLLVLGSIFLIYMTGSLVFATQAGVYIFQMIDWYVSSYCIFMTSLIEAVVVGWFYGAERFSRDVEIMTGQPVYRLVRWSWCIFTPVSMTVAFVIALTSSSSPVYGGYVYPDYVKTVGIVMGFIPVLPIPAVMVIQILRTNGSLSQRIQYLIKPKETWRPAKKEEHKTYQMYQYGNDFWYNVRINLLGTRS